MLALGYSQTPEHFHSTKDVDGILPLAWLQPPDSHEDFWQAVERTNIELEPDGLYLTRDRLEAAFSRARVPDVPEVLELFNRARPKFLALAAL